MEQKKTSCTKMCRKPFLRLGVFELHSKFLIILRNNLENTFFELPLKVRRILDIFRLLIPANQATLEERSNLYQFCSNSLGILDSSSQHARSPFFPFIMAKVAKKLFVNVILLQLQVLVIQLEHHPLMRIKLPANVFKACCFSRIFVVIHFMTYLHFYKICAYYIKLYSKSQSFSLTTSISKKILKN